MQSVGEIIRSRRRGLGLSLAQLADAVGVTKGYLSMIENAKVANPPSARCLSDLERALGIADGQLQNTAAYIRTPGIIRDQLEAASADARQARDLARWLREAAGSRSEGGRNLDELFASGELNRRLDAMLAHEPGIDAQAVAVHYRVPLINQVAAGYPTGFTDLDYPARVADDYVTCPDVTDPTAFAARVVGDSMSPNYREGDVVLFSPEAEVTDGCDCFVRIEPDHETTFKRVFFEAVDADGQPTRLRLQPLNDKFEARVLEREQIAGLYRAVARIEKL